MSEFVTLLIKDLFWFSVLMGIFTLTSHLGGNKIKDPIMLQAAVVGLVVIGFSGSLATHYGNIHSIKARIVAIILMVVVLSISMTAIKALRYKRVSS